MPQGQFTSADTEPQTPPSTGRFTAGDVEQKPSDGFFLNLAHQWIKNQIATARNPIGAGGVIEGAQPEGEFKWSDVHPSLRNVVKEAADEIKQFWPNAGAGVANLLTVGATAAASAHPFAPELPATPGAAASAIADSPITAGAAAAAKRLPAAMIEHTPIVGPATRDALKAGVQAYRTAKAAAPVTIPEPAESVYPEAQQNEPENVEPTALEQAKARFQAAQQPKPSTQTPESYPNGVQKRPTDRAEILDDKAVREQMQKDLGLQGYRGAREVGEENAPTPKWQQVAQAKAQSVIDSAHEQAAQILADAEKAATTPARLTKTVTPKAAAASQAEPVAEDLNSPDRLIDLMQQSIDRLKAAKGK